MNVKQLLTAGLLTSTAVLGFGAIAPARAGGFYEYSYEFDRDDVTRIDNNKCAACYNVDGRPIGVNDTNGIYEEISVSYNEATQTLNWSSLFTKQGSNFIDGGWLVISDGPNPKNDPLEYAIYYLDGQNETLTAFAYNGKNNSGSWQSNPFLGSWTDALNYTTDGDTSELSFSIDISGLNSALGGDWKGSAFAEEVGLWFHAGRNTSVEYTYDSNGSISGISSFSSQTKWFDTGSLDTTKTAVPEPGTLLGVGLMVTAGVLRRRRDV